MFRVEIEQADGTTFWHGGKNATEWKYPESADSFAEELWRKLQHNEEYVRFSVVEDTGVTYSDWEV